MLRRDLKGRECTEWLLASGGKSWGWLSSWGYWRGAGGNRRVGFLPSEDPAANMTGTCLSVPVCCVLFHSGTLTGIEKSRMCKEATPGSCLGCSPLSPQGRRERACNIQSCHWPVVSRTVTVLKELSDHDGSNGSAGTCLPLLPAMLLALNVSDCGAAPGE